MDTVQRQFRLALRAAARNSLEHVYEAYLERKLASLPKPKHIGIVLDGNRRWAAERGMPAARGHSTGGERVARVLEWCDAAGIEVVTLWLLSTDNLQRDASELVPLYETIERTAHDIAGHPTWRVKMVGALDLVPAATRSALEAVASATADRAGLVVNMAVAYGGRHEVVDAVRSLLTEHHAIGTSLDELAELITVEHIAEHLYTAGQPDPDLVIRTSGEQRLGGFLLWQSAKSEFWFCDAYWPDFRRIDLLRALRDFSKRSRRFGA